MLIARHTHTPLSCDIYNPPSDRVTGNIRNIWNGGAYVSSIDQ